MNKDVEFGLAPVHKEGEPVWNEEAWLVNGKKFEPKYDYTYVERRIPCELEDEAHEVLDKWLISRGIDLEEL